MKNVFYVVLGIILITLVSATTVNVMTMVPSKPKSTVFLRNAGKNEVNEWIKKGYQIKCISRSDYNVAVVLEKY